VRFSNLSAFTGSTGSFYNHPDCANGNGDNRFRWGTHFDESANGQSSDEGVGWGLVSASAGLGGYCARYNGGCRSVNSWLWVR
jgi:hypothetical protein